MFAFSLFSLAALIAAGPVHAHVALFHPSMYGFNVTDKTYPYDNRPVAPLVDLTFNQWWFHGHLDHPPNPGDVFELPAGKPATTELACNKGATSFFQSADGGDIRQGDNPCPNSPLSAIHTNGINDLTGCALAIAYKSDVTTIQPEDFTVFSVNQTCVWTRFTDFQVPANMPPCPPEGCHCAWFWIHAPDSGSEQNYMNGFKCNVTGSTSTVPLATPKAPRRCGADPANRVMNPTPGNCTYGAKSPFYWFQKERNNMNEGTFSPPSYTDLYNFRDGAQDDIFQNSYDSIPAPSPNQTDIPTLRSSPNNTGMPALPSSSSIPPCNSPAPNDAYPTPSSSTLSPPAVTVTNTVFITVTPNALPTSSGNPKSSSSSGGPIPSSSGSSSVINLNTATPNALPTSSGYPGDPGVINLNKRRPMPMKRMLSTASNLRKRHWRSRRSPHANM